MEKLKLLSRQKGEGDRRKTLIYLTKEAKKLEEKYTEVSKEIGDIYYRGFTKKEIKEFEDYLKRVLKNVEEVL